MKKNCLKDEFKMLWYTKTFVVLIVALFLFSGVIYFLNVNNTKELYDNYNKIVEFEKKNPEINSDNSDKYTVEKKDGIVSISNPRAFYEDKLTKSIDALKIKNVTSMACEAALAGFIVIFGLYGVVVGKIEYKNRTYKNKIVRRGRRRYIFSKLTSLFATSLIASVFYLLFCCLFSLLSYYYIRNKVDVNYFGYNIDARVDNIVWQLLLTLLLSLIYSLIGNTISTITRETLVGTVIIMVYSFVKMPFGKYDLSNSISFFSRKICTFEGVISLTRGGNTNIFLSSAFIICTVAICIILYVFNIYKRSAYN